MRHSIRKLLSLCLLGATLATPVLFAQRGGKGKKGGSKHSMGGGRKAGAGKAPTKGGGRGGR